MKERLEAFLKDNSMSYAKFAEAMDVVPARISHIMNGRNNPSFDFIETMLTRFPEINPDWLILGQGPMYRDRNPSTGNPQPKPLPPFVQKELFEKEPPLIANTIPTNSPRTKEIESDTRNNSVHTLPNPQQNNAPNEILAKKIARVLIFYSDNTFDEYLPHSRE